MRKICLFFALTIFCFVLCAIFCTKAHSEIVIEKLEDPAYLDPAGTIYTPKKVEQKENAPCDTTSVTTQTLYGSSISSATLSKIEKKVFGRNFVGDNNLNRLTRLEQKVFGAVQRGNTTNRVQRLKTATQSYTNNYAYAPNYYNRTYRTYPGYNYYNNPYNMYAPYRPYKRTRLKNMFRALTGASLTGFSPPVSDISEEANKIAQNSYSQNSYTNSTIDPYAAYNSSTLQGYSPNSGYSNGYSWSNQYQNPYSGSTYSTYAGPNVQNNGYYTPANAPTNRMDIFSNGASGSESYYDDGRYRRNMSSTGGGCGVKIIY